MKYKTILVGALLAVSLLVTNYVTKKDNNPKKEDNKSSLAIMVEQNNGTYQAAQEIPIGYTLNETKSGCENGGTVTYDGTKVSMKASSSDKCYLYFDIPE